MDVPLVLPPPVILTAVSIVAMWIPVPVVNRCWRYIHGSRHIRYIRPRHEIAVVQWMNIDRSSHTDADDHLSVCLRSRRGSENQNQPECKKYACFLHLNTSDSHLWKPRIERKVMAG
jgi:hypothetical protein